MCNHCLFVSLRGWECNYRVLTVFSPLLTEVMDMDEGQPHQEETIPNMDRIIKDVSQTYSHPTCMTSLVEAYDEWIKIHQKLEKIRDYATTLVTTEVSERVSRVLPYWKSVARGTDQFIKALCTTTTNLLKMDPRFHMQQQTKLIRKK